MIVESFQLRMAVVFVCTCASAKVDITVGFVSILASFQTAATMPLLKRATAKRRNVVKRPSSRQPSSQPQNPAEDFARQLPVL